MFYFLDLDTDKNFYLQESYEALPIEQKVTILLGAVTNVAEISEEGRSLSAVMLRRLFSNEFEEFFGKVSWIFK